MADHKVSDCRLVELSKRNYAVLYRPNKYYTPRLATFRRKQPKVGLKRGRVRTLNEGITFNKALAKGFESHGMPT